MTTPVRPLRPRLDLFIPLVRPAATGSGLGEPLLLRVGLVSSFGAHQRCASVHPLLQRWWHTDRVLYEYLPAGVDCWSYLAIELDAAHAPKLYSLFRTSLGGPTVNEQEWADTAGNSYQLPLCIAAWALALAEATGDVAYLRAAGRCHLSGSLIPEDRLRGVQEKAAICIDHAELGRDVFVILTDPGDLSATLPPGVHRFHRFEDAFHWVFADCPISNWSKPPRCSRAGTGCRAVGAVRPGATLRRAATWSRRMTERLFRPNWTFRPAGSARRAIWKSAGS